MATDAATLDFLLDQLGRRASRFSTRRMFGEYCLYRDGQPVALVCDDVLFVKDTPAGRDAMASIAALDFSPPYPGARPHLRLPPDLWDDGDAVRRLLDVSADALPAPKPKAPRASKKTSAVDTSTLAVATKSGTVKKSRVRSAGSNVAPPRYPSTAASLAMTTPSGPRTAKSAAKSTKGSKSASNSASESARTSASKSPRKADARAAISQRPKRPT